MHVFEEDVMDPRTSQATELMMQFAERTGLVGDQKQKRYLWTDAFAVCNFLALGMEDHARALVTRVHHTLARHRDDDARIGWLSGLEGTEAEAHPTRGGLRIGKPMPERETIDPFSEKLEWERDGQYFHYLTKWMHALDVMGRATGEADYHRWAIELAVVAHRRFTYDTRAGKRMYWKLSIDLMRPLVASMGHHDPLDGFITAVQLGAVPPEVITDYASMLELGQLATTDPLGLGGLLVDACRVAQLVEHETWLRDVELLDPLLSGALIGLHMFLDGGGLDGGAERRLGFRELGLAIGLAGLDRIGHVGDLSRTTRHKLDELVKLAPVRAQIEEFWLEPAHRRTQTWVEHADINDVMLATSLVPDGFLDLPARSPHRAAASERRAAREERRHP